MDQLRTRLVGLAIAVFVFGIAPATAEPITFTFTGTITGLEANSADPVSQDINHWLSGLSLGIPFSGMLQYDTTAPPTVGNAFNIGLPGFEMSVGPYVFGSGGATLTVSHNAPPIGDSLIFTGFLPTLSGSTPNLFSPDDLVLQLHDPSGTALSNQSIPVVDLNLFTTSQAVFDGFGFDAQGRSALVDVSGSIDHFQSVPEPSILLLMGLGAAALGRRALKAGRRA